MTVRCCTTDGAPTSRVAILARDKLSDDNYISRPLVTKVFHKDIQPFEKEATMRIRTQLQSEEVEGYVDLDWCLEHDREKWQTTRFFVTTTCNPPYDAVLGKMDAGQYGLARRRNKR
jgi:hypothetical protein